MLRHAARPGEDNQGPFDPNTNDQSLADGTGTDRQIYWADQDGTIDFGSGPLTFRAGDYAQYLAVDAKWHRITAAPLTLTPIKTADYAAEAGDLVQVDTTLAEVNVTFPTSPAVDDRIGVVKVTNRETNAVVVQGGSNTIIPPLNVILSSTQIAMVGFYAMIAWRWDGVNWMPDGEARARTPVQLYQATPIVGVGTDVIQWTFAPTFTGQPELLFTLAGGVFTSQGVAQVSASLAGEWTFQLSGNNSDAEIQIAETFNNVSGTGDMFMPRILQPFAHARGGAFSQNGGTQGEIDVGIGDNFSFTATGFGTGLSTVDLDELVLVLKIG